LLVPLLRVTLYFLQNKVFENKSEHITTEKVQNLLASIRIDFRYNESTKTSNTFLNDIDVENEIRQLEVASHVSMVASIKEVRTKLVDLQRQMGMQKRFVLDGRDIGTVVFPDAELKLFMTARPEIRAQRRYDELSGKGETVNFTDILNNIIERDHIDETRAESPLRKANDAVILDNTHMTIEQQMEWFVELLRKKTLI